MQPPGIFSEERIFSKRILTALSFPPASKRRKLYGNSGWAEPPRRRSAARLSERLCPTAKLCSCHAQIKRQRQSSSLRPLNLRHANNGGAVASCCDNNSSTQRHLLRAHPHTGHLNGGYTPPLNHRPSKRHHPRAFSLE